MVRHGKDLEDLIVKARKKNNTSFSALKKFSCFKTYG
jgi:hypothetical protein